MIQSSRDFMGRNLSWKVMTLPSLVAVSMHCAGGNMFLLVEGQDSTYPFFNLPLLFISKAHGTPCSHKPNFRTLKMKDSRPWSHMSTRTTGGNNLKNFCQSVQKEQREGEKEKKTTIVLYALHSNPKSVTLQ